MTREAMTAKLKPILFFSTIFLFIPLATVLLIEGIHRGALSAFFEWAGANTLSFVFTYIFMILFIGIIYFLPSKIFYLLAILQMIMWAVISFGSFQKFQLRGDPFVPADFYLLQEGADISSVLNDILTKKDLLGAGLLLFVLAMLIWAFVKFGVTISFKYRLLISSISLFLCILLVNNVVKYTVKDTAELVIAEKYQKLGFIGGFMNAVEEAKGEEPEGYSKAKITSIIEKSKDADADTDPDFKPNVVVVLAESFWDPMLLENANFQDDPIPFFRSLTENHPSGNLLVHNYGGGTLNSELEVLTGLTTRFLPEGANTYYQHVVRPVDSLAHVFKDQGYHTTALHNFQSWFYKRGDIYKWLGFEKFVSMEFLNDPVFIGDFVDDREIIEQTIEELNLTEGPDFINTVTVATHADYNNRKFENLKQWSKADLSELDQHRLNEYSQALKELDEAFKMLIEGVEKLDEPTMVVIYGDHLPALGMDYSIYKDIGYLKDLNQYEDYLKMYSTPLVVWDNFSKDSEKEKLRMTPNYLGSYILDKAKKEKSPIFEVSGEAYNNGVNVIPAKQFLAEEKVDEKKLEDYKQLQYDMIFGERYAYREKPLKTVPGYHHGSEKLQLKSVKVDQNGVIRAEGKGFVKNAAIYLDGEKLETEYHDSRHVSAAIPEKFKGKGKVSITVEVIDRKEKVLAGSKPKEITLK
jgi:phosphoglycerol transferase MdoB-like AlkP superfamily enzyme